MSNVYLVLCTRSPARAVKKRRPVTGFKIIQRELADDDPLPDPSWKKRVVAVVEARGKNEGITSWLEHVAAATDGAVYDDRSGELTYLDSTEATKRAKRFLAAGDGEGLLAWIRAVAPDEYETRHWETIDAIRDVVVRSKKKQPEVVLALHAICRDDDKIEDIIIALAKTGGEAIGKAARSSIGGRRPRIGGPASPTRSRG